MLNDTLKLIKSLFSAIFGLLTSLFQRLDDAKIYLVDLLFNGIYYKYYISAILLLIAFLSYLIIYKFNPFNIFKTKYGEISFIFILSLCLCIFYFSVYRKDSTDHYVLSLELKSKINNSSNESSNGYKKKYEYKKNDNQSDKTNFYITLFLPLLNLFKSLLSILAIILVPVILITLLFTLHNNYQEMFYITQIFLGILIIITLLAIVIYLSGLYKPPTEFDINQYKDGFSFKIIFAIIKNLILFIPCLLIALSLQLSKDIKATPSPVYILFIIELLLICLFFIFPVFMSYISSLDKNNLLQGKGPYYINKEKIIGKYQLLNNQKSLNKDESTRFSIFEKDIDQEYNLETIFNGPQNPKKNIYNYTYSISFYLYLNPQPKNTNYAYNKEEGANIFNYGNKPKIIYDGLNRKIIIKSQTKNNSGETSEEIIFESKTEKENNEDNNEDKEDNINIDIKYQKWLFFVINYDNGVIDVFIDGKLVGSKENVPNFNNNDKVIIGEDNGIHGSIRDIYYYKTIRSPSNIEFLYDLTKN